MNNLLNIFLNLTYINEEKINKILSAYNSPTVDNNCKILLSGLETDSLFFNETEFLRLLSFDEVTNPIQEISCDFASFGLIPLFDISDNNFICFDYSENTWCKFNINDETKYSRKQNLFDLF